LAWLSNGSVLFSSSCLLVKPPIYTFKVSCFSWNFSCRFLLLVTCKKKNRHYTDPLLGAPQLPSAGALGNTHTQVMTNTTKTKQYFLSQNNHPQIDKPLGLFNFGVTFK
jgi:hypothetical protein